MKLLVCFKFDAEISDHWNWFLVQQRRAELPLQHSFARRMNEKWVSLNKGYL